MTNSPDQKIEMPKAYEPQLVEQRQYKFWLDGGYFKPKIDHNKKPFTVIMPPPNITGELHVGHALTATVEDILVRWHRMKGDPTLWLPGTDHSGIYAQVVVEKLLATEGLSRHDLGREKFLDRMWEWVRKTGRTITEQHMKLGVSADWSRERFTLDPGPSRAVRTTFVNLYRKGLIYRGERMINWCPRCSTALSDLEVDHESIAGELFYVRYPLVPGGQGSGDRGQGTGELAPGPRPLSPTEYITVATTRPETILGDTAVAVNPKDERYAALIGRIAILPAVNRQIPIIADEAVEPAFGTGAVKITPAHDLVDFEVGQRHGLPSIRIMNFDATMNENAGPYAGMDRYDCRKALLADLRKDGLLVSIEPYQLPLGQCERCKTAVEPLVSKQWFVDIKPLARPAIDAITSGQIKIIPERFGKVYLNWMENIRDWCISRQIWWGHRIPVWYCEACGDAIVEMEDPTRCPKCGSEKIDQDPDNLDTWFSSGLWPHSTLGWPDDTEDFRFFYPTSVMETAYDILFFWVARMIMMGIENTGEIPFHTVYLHGLVRDEKGRKMSKSLGNVVNPLDVMAKFGTDALRYALSTGSTPGNDSRLSETKVEAGRNFANKLWNSARFVLGGRTLDELRAAGLKMKESAIPGALADRWILSRLNHVAADANRLLGEFQLGEAGRQIHDFIWNEFCDWYIEMAKIRLHDVQKMESQGNPLPVLLHVLDSSLRLLHPFMPFVTEEIWQNLRQEQTGDGEVPASIMVAPYPEADVQALDEEAERDQTLVMDCIRAIRNARAEFGVEPAKWIEVVIVGGRETEMLSKQEDVLKQLARVGALSILPSLDNKPKQALSLLVDSVEVYLPIAGMVDLEAESRRLQKEIASIGGEIERAEAKLANVDFVARAPAAVVERERERLSLNQDKQAKLREGLLALGR
ncbi:MAG: valine--tRNA ligase [Dehalococcoidia bacterium]|nr:valine--tRNA ligase [Dehalococcoidia bacterium]